MADSKVQSRSLSLLQEASTLLDEASDLGTPMKPILEALSRHMDVDCATVTVLNRRTSEILVHEAIGLSADQRERGRYRLGEGITGRVVQTGEPVVVPSIATEPLFLGRARSLKDRPGMRRPSSVYRFGWVTKRSGP